MARTPVQASFGRVSTQSKLPPRNNQQSKLLTPLPPLPSRRNMPDNETDSSKVAAKNNDLKIVMSGDLKETTNMVDSSMTTIKKGTLWQQQNFNKIHQRLFNRWKKRYFILTTDYLVCFSRTSSKVGCSDMGKFLYKVSSSTLSLFILYYRIDNIRA